MSVRVAASKWFASTAVSILFVSTAYAVPIGFLSFDPLLPGPGGTNAIFLYNLTGDPALSGGSALPPDFPVNDFLIFQSVSLVITFSDATSLPLILGDIPVGAFLDSGTGFPPSALQFPDTLGIRSVSVAGTLSQTTLSLSGGGSFEADPQWSGELLPSLGANLEPGFDFLILEARSRAVPVPEPASLFILASVFTGLFVHQTIRKRRQRVF